MDLWPEMKLLEQTNLTRGGAWLELVRTKQESLEHTPPKKEAKSSERPLSKRQQFRLVILRNITPQILTTPKMPALYGLADTLCNPL